MDDNTANRAVELPRKAAVVVQRSAGRRNRVYQAPDVMDVWRV